MADYQKQIEELFNNTSLNAQKIIKETLTIEKRKKWQHSHRGLDKEISDDITIKVKDIIK